MSGDIDLPRRTDVTTPPDELEGHAQVNAADHDVTGDEDDVTQLEDLARGGDPAAQTEYGARLVSQAEGATAPRAFEGVRWLVCAARQGHEPAVEHLQRCLDTNTGVVSENLTDVRWCVDTPHLERVARHAARQLFARLNPLQRQISADDFVRAVEDTGASDVEKTLLKRAAKCTVNEHINEDYFVERVVDKLRGSGSIILTPSVDSDDQFENTSFCQKILLYPSRTLSFVAIHAIETASSQGLSWLRSLVPTRQIYTLFAFVLYSVLSLHVLGFLLPLVLFYFALLALVICTMQMFHSQCKLGDVRAVASMLQRFHDSLEVDSAASAYTWRSLTPYVTFMTSLVVLVFAYILADKAWVPSSELTVLSLFFTCACFAGLSDSQDHLALISILCDVIASIPHCFYEDSPIYETFYGPLARVPLAGGVSLNVSLCSLSMLLVPLLFLRMAMRRSWRGTYQVLVPHLVCFLWWQLTVLFFSHSTPLGLLRGSIGWLAVLLLLPVAGVVLFLLPLLHLYKLFSIATCIKLLTTAVLLCIPAGFALYARRDAKNSYSKARVVLSITACFLSAVPLVYLVKPAEYNVGGNYLTWESYKRFCSYPQWNRTNIAHAMIQCAHFKHTMVAWEGQLTKLTVFQVTNQVESLITWMPFVMSDWIRCSYGRQYGDCDQVTITTEQELCRLRTMQRRLCHLQHLNHYTFELWISIPVDAARGQYQEMRVRAGHWFQRPLLDLKAGDHVFFRAALIDGIGNIRWPILNLYYLECRSCDVTVKCTECSEQAQSYWGELRRAVRQSLKFFWDPLLVFD